MEEIHKLPKSTKWERTEDAYEAYPQEEGYDEECSTSWPKTAQEQGYVKEADEGSDDGGSEEQSEEGFFEGAKGVNEEAARQLIENLDNQIKRETARENKREREYRKRIIEKGYEQGLTAVQRSIEQEDYDETYYEEETYEEGYAEEAYEGYDDGTYEEEGYDDEAYNQEEGYDDEAYEGYDDGTYEQEGYDEEAYEQEEGYDDEAYEQEDWYGDEAHQDQDQDQDWYGDEAYQDQEQEWYGDEAYQDQEQEWYGDEAETYEEDTNQYGQCIFFASPEGCRRGNECKSANTGTIVTQIRVNHSRHQAKIRNGSASLADANRHRKPLTRICLQQVDLKNYIHKIECCNMMWHSLQRFHPWEFNIWVDGCDVVQLSSEKKNRWLEWIDVAISKQLSIKTSYWKSWWLH